jgi:hypothetical protein
MAAHTRPPADQEVIMGHSPAIPLITTLAAHSPVAQHKWEARGTAPIGYVKGMAVAFGRVYCKLKRGDALAVDMARPDIGDDFTDALAHLRALFVLHGMDNSHGGVDTLRHLFVVLYALGMRESSGQFSVGRDPGNKNPAASSSEAGLFQVSYDSHGKSLLLDKLIQQYRGSTDFLDIFKEGVSPRTSDLRSDGTGAANEFQNLNKNCPAFAVEYACLALRHVRQYSGPINRKTIEITRVCDELFLAVQRLIDDAGHAAV